MQDQGNSYLLEDGTGHIVLENGSGVLILETAPAPININNYEFVKVGDGMSTGEKIR